MIPPEDIIKTIASTCNTTQGILMGRGQHRYTEVYPRTLCYIFLYAMGGLSYPAIARLFRGRNTSGVYLNVQKGLNLIETKDIVFYPMFHACRYVMTKGDTHKISMLSEAMDKLYSKKKKPAQLTLTQWANKNYYNVLKVDGRRAWVDKIPSQWLSPQWVGLPDNVLIENSWL